MEKAIVLGGGSDQRSLIEELRKRVDTIILIDYYDNPPAKDLVDRHYVTSTLDLNAVLRIARDEKAELVTTACIDQAILTMAYVSEQLGLVCPVTYTDALRVTNKYYMKDRFARYEIPTARFQLVEGKVDAFNCRFPYPVVVKPADSNGSFGIRKVHSEDEAKDALVEALRISRSKKAIVEQYIEGTELSIDAFVIDGEAYLLLITQTQKNLSLKDSFTICQSRYPVVLETELLVKIQYVVNRIVSSFRLDNTPLLVQIVTDRVNVYVLEFGVRIAGGSKHHLIEHITGFDVMKAYVDTLFDTPVYPEIKPYKKQVSMNYVYARPGLFFGVAGIEELLAEKTMEKFFLYKTPGMNIANNQASRDRIGAFLVEGNDESDLVQRLRSVDSRLKVLGPQNNDIMIHGLYG